jgi:hypothetical protein
MLFRVQHSQMATSKYFFILSSFSLSVPLFRSDFYTEYEFVMLRLEFILLMSPTSSDRKPKSIELQENVLLQYISFKNVFLCFLAFSLRTSAGFRHIHTFIHSLTFLTPILFENAVSYFCVFSLNPYEDRFAFSVIWEITPQGDIVNEWFGKTSIFLSSLSLSLSLFLSLMPCYTQITMFIVFFVFSHSIVLPFQLR